MPKGSSIKIQNLPEGPELDVLWIDDEDTRNTMVFRGQRIMIHNFPHIKPYISVSGTKSLTETAYRIIFEEGKDDAEMQ
jgi:hypothetical protein